MKKSISAKIWIASLISGLLLSLPYILSDSGLIALVALIPLFAAEKIATENKIRHFWLCYYCAFLVWNIVATWWIYYATPGGAIAAITLNALQMALIFRVFRWLKKRFVTASGTLLQFLPYLGFATLWLAWEHCYSTWQISWPWLFLGNSFADTTTLIQWYEFTGSLGGSLWIILCNILIFNTIVKGLDRQKRAFPIGAFSVAMAAIFIPIAISITIYFRPLPKASESGSLAAKEVVILQPNIDPYYDKFGGINQSEQNHKLLTLADKAVTDSTALIVAPETFFNPSIEAGVLIEDMPYNNRTLAAFSEYAKAKSCDFLFGAVTHKYYGNYKPTRTARQMRSGIWYDLFNTAVYADMQGECSFYHKSKLVILAESVPYIGDKSFFNSLGIDLGGGIGNFGTQPYRTLFKMEDGTKFGTAICYESVFGEFYTEYIQAGANFMTIITNDGWWHNTSGHIQHLNYARIRAIETRRDIARCANTGISAFINQKGDIVSQTPWWEECFLKGHITPNSKITAFVKYGDIVGRTACYIIILIVLIAIFYRASGRRSASGKSL